MKLPPMFSALFCSIFEISGADAIVARLLLRGISREICLALTFFSQGFGGLCIYAQVLSVAPKSEVRPKSYLLFKLTQGGICALIAFILTRSSIFS